MDHHAACHAAVFCCALPRTISLLQVDSSQASNLSMKIFVDNVDPDE